ncbi:MAG: HYR domain-containing protein [Saprospiraceae bacterium]|nr:HYR domain-containing protein [Saprospiraceae bacterium]
MRTHCLLFLLTTLFFSQNINAQCSGFSVNAGQDQAVCFPAGTATLNGSISGSFENYIWSPATGLSDPNILNPTAFVNSPITYTLSAQGLDPNAPNLIQNGDFEQGNTSFSSVYTNNQTNLINPGTYAIITSPDIVLATFPSCDDHTTGTGNMMVVHGQNSAGNNVWCQTVPVTPNKTYEFATWIMTVVPFFPSSFDFTINGQSLSGPQTFPANNICEWAEFDALWDSGSATTATICIVDQGGGGFINGYALDDISLKELCTETDNVTLNLVSVDAVLPVLEILPCNIPAQGFALDGSGSTSGPNITYFWQTGDGNIVSGMNDPIAYVDQEGTYTLTVTYNDGFAVCSDLAVITVIDDPDFPLAFADVSEIVDCFNPTIEIDGSGSSEGSEYNYQWTTSDGNIVSGGNSLFPTVDAGGTYDLLVTNSDNGCTAEATVTIEENLNIPDADALSNNDINCDFTTSILDGSGSSQGNNFSYEWTTLDGNILSGEFDLMPEVDEAGTYTITVTNDINGCTNTAEVTVDENIAQPNPQIEVPEIVNCTNSLISLDASNSGGQGNLTANWTTNDGIILSGENTLTPDVNGVGTYTLVIMDDSNGCTATDEVTIEGDFEAPSIDILDPEMLTCSLISILIDATNSSNGNNFSYDWTTSNGNILNGQNTLEPEVNQSGNYELTITNNDNGCTSTDNIEVTGDTIEPTAEAGDPTEIDCDNSAVELDASSSSQGNNFSYEWATSDGNILSGIDTLIAEVDAAGTYIFSVTNVNNDCVRMDTVEVTLNANIPTADAGNAEDFDCLTTEIELDGQNSSQGNHTYNWTALEGNILNGENTLMPSIDTAGTYVIEVTDTLNNCISTDTITVSENFNLPIANAGVNLEIPCHPDTLELNGNNSSQGNNIEYNWTTINGNIINGAMDSIAEINAVGIYTLQVTDTDNGCTATSEVEVLQSNNPTVNIDNQTAIDCNGNENAEATAIGSGGTPDYLFEWSSGGNTATETGLGAGIYEVTITDKNGCQNTTEVTILEPPVLEVEMEGIAESGFGLNDGTATANPNGGSSDYTYEWSNGETSQTITDLEPGNYCVTITDQNGCTTTGCYAVNPFLCGGISANFETTNVSCFEANNGEATIEMMGGTAPFLFEWSNGEIGETLTNLVAQTYNVTATDDNGCVVLETITITEPDPVQISVLNITDAACAGSATGAASVEANGGTPNFNYEWSNGSMESFIENVVPAMYSVTATDINDCSETITIEITGENDNEAPIALTQNIIVVLDENGMATITPEMIDNGSNDNCELGDLTLDISEFSCTDLGQVIVTLTANDVSGNSASETAIVTILDENAPVLTCPDDIFSNFCLFPVNYPVPTAQDGCGNATITQLEGLPSGSIFPSGTTVLTYSATDDSSNETTCSFTITVMTDMTAEMDIINVNCFGDPTGEATLMIDGGTPPFEYQWNDPALQVTQTATGLAAGTYSPTIIDATGCEIGAMVEITEPEELTIDSETTEPDCFGDETGTAIAIPNGGTLPYSYQWNDPDMQTTSTASGLSAGMYEIIVLDSNNCEISTSVNIEQPTEVQIALDEIINETGQNSDGLISITPSGGSGMGYTFEWTFNGDFYSNEEDLTDLMGGEYCVTITDENGCEQTECFNIEIINATLNPTLEEYISIFPNPTSQALNVNMKLPATSLVKITIYDALGREVLENPTVTTQDQAFIFDVSEFGSGVYFMKLMIDDEVLGQRIIVE